MHLLSLPRHRIETTLGDYARIIGSLAAGPNRPRTIERFERAFADYLGCAHAVAVSSGRLAIHLLLEQLAVEPGHEVIIPAFNLSAAVERFCQFGLIPRFCDVLRKDLTIEPAAARELVGNKTRMILATHMYGHPANMDEVRALADAADLILIEDCAHALGTHWKGRSVGTFGRAGVFSFSVLKLITTFGGGMIATDDADLARAIRLRRGYLRERRPNPAGLRKAIKGTALDLGTRNLAFSFAAWPALRLVRLLKPNVQQQIMTETPRPDRTFDPATVPPLHPFQAALGLSQLRKVDALIDRRREVSRWMDESLADIEGLELLHPARQGRHNALYYGVLVEQPAALSAHLFRHGVDSETSEYLNCADLEFYRDGAIDCPVARDIQSRILRLPNYPGLSRRHVGRIARIIRRYMAARRKPTHAVNRWRNSNARRAVSTAS